MENTFYYSKDFTISDYQPNDSKTTIELTLQELSLNSSLRTLFCFIPFLYDNAEKEVDAFTNYLTACQFGYSAHRKIMLEKLRKSEKLFIQIRNDAMAKKVLEAPNNFNSIDKKYLCYLSN